ncbi:MAG: glycosyltransferase family 2 protein [Bacteroidetes bacterium]|nr:glycosyltransferase family 2 protein [Bacteroidota bacterium]
MPLKENIKDNLTLKERNELLDLQLKSRDELVNEVVKSKKDIKHLHEQLHNAFKSIDQLIKRISELESSKFYKLRKFITLYIKRLRGNVKKGNKKNIFSVIYNYVFKRGGRVLRIIFAKILKHIYLLVEVKKVMIVEVFTHLLSNQADYNQYLTRKLITRDKRKIMLGLQKNFLSKPLISIVIPVYNPPINFFRKALDSVVKQIYGNWEICIADDCSTDDEVKEVIEEYRKKYSNIKVVYRTENGHISKASNSAIELATGEYTLLLDQDDELKENALFEIVKLINQKPDADLIYSDEDKIDEDNIHMAPHFKPDWSPDSLLSRNYICHVSVFKTSQLKEIGGFRVGFEGSQDHDLLLRYTEKYTNIYHIPEVLYHWRIHEYSVASSEGVKPYAYRAAQTAITEALERRGYKGDIGLLDGFVGYSVRLEIKQPNALVSIIIPTKDKQKYLEQCIDSIVNLSEYRNFEIILIDNNSSEKGFFKLIEKYKNQKVFKFIYVRDEKSFNFSRLMNLGRTYANGEYILLLNNDTQVISPDWINGLMEHAQRPEIGVVGCKLLFDDDTIQHAGVVVGLGGVASHVFLGDYVDEPGYFHYKKLLNNYSALTAACIMMRTSVYDEVNGFNEEFVVEYNDVDFCLKVIEKGYRNLYVPHVLLYHYESISRGHPHATSEGYKRHVKEVNLFRKKWMKYVDHDPCYNPNLTRDGVHFTLK